MTWDDEKKCQRGRKYILEKNEIVCVKREGGKACGRGCGRAVGKTKEAKAVRKHLA